jgi:transposase-like protein
MNHRQIDARVISTRAGVILTQSGGGERNEEAMKHYTLSIAAEKLGIDDVTLWRWMRESRVKPRRDPTDWRRRRISKAQLITRAVRHHRLVLIEKEDQNMSDLEARIFDLEQEVLALSRTVKKLMRDSDPPGEEEPTRDATRTTVGTLLAQVRAMQERQAR